MFLVVIGVLAIIFVVSHVLPANPAKSWAGIHSTEEQVQRLREKYRLDDPVYLQFYYYLKQLFSGDLGKSPVTNNPVIKDIQRFAPATLELALVAVLLGGIGGLFLGIISAVYKGSFFDQLSRILALTGIAMPLFWFGLLLQFGFSFKLGWLPFHGRIGLMSTPPPSITGLYILDSIISGNWKALIDSLRHLALPAFTLSFFSLVRVTRITRSSMIETLSSDYINTAYAKGLSKTIVVFKHALRNSISSTLSVVGLTLAYTLGGTVVVEVVFSWPGIGRYAASAIETLDFPALMGFMLVIAGAVVFVNLLIDLSYGLADPRIRYT